MRLRPVPAIFLVYLALTVVMTWPLVTAPATLVPADVGDPLLNAWILWWNAHSVPLTSAWWSPPAFYPSHHALAFSEHLLGLAWLTSPLQWAGVDPLGAYNAAFLASWVLGGVTAYLLGYELTGRVDAALVGSAVFAWAPYRASQLSHLQVISSYWMPLALMAAHRYVRTGATRWAVVFACAWLVQGLTNGYYLVFFGVLAAAWTLWFTAARGRWMRLAGLASAGTGVVLASLPLLITYRDVHEHYGFQRSPEEIAGYSADVLALLNASTHLAVWGRLQVFPRAEGELFPGIVVLLVIAGGLLLGPVAGRRAPWQRIARGVVAGAWLAAVAGCASYGVFGRWKASWLGIAVSIRDPLRPLWTAVFLGVVLAVTRPGLRCAVVRRSPLLFYLSAAVVLWSCTLGPRPTMAGTALGWTSPYGLLSSLPGFAGLRVPARFWMLVIVCLSAAAGLAYARWPLPARWRTFAAAVVIALIVGEGWVGTLRLEAVPEPWPSLVTRGSATPILQLPGFPRQSDPVAMYRAAAARRPLVNGYSGFFPPEHGILVQALGTYDLSVLNGLSARGPLEILLDRWEDDHGRFGRLLRDSRATMTAHDARWSLFTLPQLPPASVLSPSGAAARPVAAQASINGDIAWRVFDGRADTAWYTDIQRPAQTLTLDMGRLVRAGAVRLVQGREPLAYPRLLEVDTSGDGVTWTRAWAGPTAALAWLAAVDAPRVIPVTVPLDGCPARYLRLRLTAESQAQRWSVAEASVVEPSPGASRVGCQR